MSRSYTHHICARECRAAHRNHRSRICHHLQVQQSLWLQNVLFSTPTLKRKSFLGKELACTLKDNTIEPQKFILQAQGATLYLHTDLRGTRASSLQYLRFFIYSCIHNQRTNPKVTSSVISQHLLRSYDYFYSRTFPEFFTCEKKKAGLTGLVSLPTQKQQCKPLPQCHINKSDRKSVV